MRPGKKALTDAESVDVSLRIIANVSPHGVFRVANDGRLAFVNQRLCDLFGVRSEQVNNPKSWLRPLHPEDRSAARRAWRMALRERSAWSYECRIIPKDRILKWLKISLEPLFSA